MGDFEYVKELGQGAYGKVYLVRKVSSGDFYAMKIIGVRKDIDDAELLNIINEKNVFQLVDSDFCVNALGSFVYKSLICFVIDFMEGGDFFQFAFEG
jgi:serine/threonine protein kinase